MRPGRTFWTYGHPRRSAARGLASRNAGGMKQSTASSLSARSRPAVCEPAVGLGERDVAVAHWGRWPTSPGRGRPCLRRPWPPWEARRRQPPSAICPSPLVLAAHAELLDVEGPRGGPIAAVSPSVMWRRQRDFGRGRTIRADEYSLGCGRAGRIRRGQPFHRRLGVGPRLDRSRPPSHQHNRSGCRRAPRDPSSSMSAAAGEVVRPPRTPGRCAAGARRPRQERMAIDPNGNGRPWSGPGGSRSAW